MNEIHLKSMGKKFIVRKKSGSTKLRVKGNDFHRKIALRQNSASEIEKNVRGLDIPELKEVVHNKMDTLQKTDVVFGAYGPDDWATSTWILDQIKNQKNSIIESGTWLITPSWNKGKYAELRGYRYNYITKNQIIMYAPWGIIIAYESRDKIDIDFYGDEKSIKDEMQEIDQHLSRAGSMIEWIYDSRGSSIDVPLDYRPLIRSAYPWIDDIDAYVDDYLKSRSGILILIGPPGTGKTSLIKHLIHVSGSDALVTYDKDIMGADSLFANFINGDSKFLIMEDADTFLSSRSDGNTMMHKFLNVADGLVSSENKKLIFSTNLPSISDIDDALTRPGRCFGILEHRNLTKQEVQNVCDEMKVENRFTEGKDNVSLADILNEQRNTKNVKTNGKVGFY